MEFIKVTVYTNSAGCEAVCDRLEDLAGGFEIDDPAEIERLIRTPSTRWDYIEEGLMEAPDREAEVRFYLNRDEGGLWALDQARAMVDGLRESAQGQFGSLRFASEPVQSQDWENNWKQYYRPFSVGKRLLVRPSWEQADNPEGRAVLVMDPASSFGTGSHATTRLCMEQLDLLVRGGERVLDVGCGSGILAAAAMHLGAAQAVLCDIEENAVRTASANLESNGFAAGSFAAWQGDLLTEPALRDRLEGEGPYDVILANIVADVLIRMAGVVPRWLKAGGCVILSGIIESRAGEVRDAYQALPLELVEERRRDGWAMQCWRAK